MQYSSNNYEMWLIYCPEILQSRALLDYSKQDRGVGGMRRAFAPLKYNTLFIKNFISNAHSLKLNSFFTAPFFSLATL